jgi:competence protein ComEC
MDGRGAWLLPGLLAGVMVGIATADAGWLGTAVIAVVMGWFVAGVALRLVARKMLGSAVLVAAALLLGMALGGVRGLATTPPGGPESVDVLAADTTWRVTGTVADEPTPRGDAIDLVLDDLQLAGGGLLAGRVLVRVPRSAAVTAGDRVAVAVSIWPPDPADAEGIAYRERLRRQGIGALGRAFEVTVIGHRSDPLTDSFGSVRRWLLDGLVTTVPEPEASLGAGILLGVRAGIDPAVRDAFAVAGLSHVVAISGWNVAIVVVLIGALTRRLRRRAGPALPAVVAVVAVAGYVVLVGASPAVVRAALMAGALLVSRLGGSPAHAGSALMAAVVVMLVISPAALWDVGFQLSALATGGLIVLGGTLEQRLGRWPAWIRTPVALTVAAQLATLPVLLATFEQVSLVAPLANVVVVPLVPAVMAGSALAAVVGGLTAAMRLPGIGDAAAWLAGGTAWLPLRALIVAGIAAAELPLAALPVAGGPWLTLAWYPLLGLAARRLSRRSDPGPPTASPLEVAGRPGLPQVALPEAAAFATALTWVGRPRRAAAGLVLVLTMATVLTGPDGRLHMTVLDVGQGDAILIEGPDGTTALVDGGVDPDLTLRRLGEALPYHERQIDVLLSTHPDLDHIGGLGEVVHRYRVVLIMDNGRLPETDPHKRLLTHARAEPGASIRAARAGEVIRLGAGAGLEILFPSDTDLASPVLDGDRNNTSVVALLRYGRFTAILTGDAEASVETLLAARGLLGPVDVLKVGHHGSRSSTTDAFLAAIQPSVAIISVGGDNSYGHPHSTVLENLAEISGLDVFRTDLDGNVEVVTDGRGYWVISRRGQTTPAPAGGGEPVRAWAGRIGPWPSPTALPPAACWPPSVLPRGWSPTPRAWRGWPGRRPERWRTTAWKSTLRWSKPQPASMTSIRSRLVPLAGMGWWPPNVSPSSATPSWRTRSPPIPSTACSTPSDFRAAGPPSACPWPIGGLGSTSATSANGWRTLPPATRTMPNRSTLRVSPLKRSRPGWRTPQG